MRIIFVFESTYPNYTGGVETWIYNVCEGLADENDISIITVEDYRKESFTGRFENINTKIKLIPVRDLNQIPLIRFFIHKHLCVINSLYISLKMYNECLKLIDDNQTCFVIALGTVFTPISLIRLKKKFMNIKTVSSCRTLEPELLGEAYPGLGMISKELQKKNLRVMDDVWSNGLDTYEYLKGKGIESFVIKNGVDYELLKDATPYDYNEIGLKGKTIIVTVGTVSSIKGYKEIIQAVALLNNKFEREVHFVGVGKVRQKHKERYMAYAKQYKVNEQVHLIGERRNTVSYDKGADVVICASGGAGYGMSILEAMVSQTPIVAWNNSVHVQLLEDNKTAKLVDAWDSNKLAEGIDYVLSNMEEAKKWGIQASIKAKEFDWKVVMNQVVSRLNEL